VIISFLLIGEAIDTYLHDHEVTAHFKLLGGIVGTGAILFLARMMKGIFVRRPIKAEDHL
jgi:hypothetical protein